MPIDIPQNKSLPIGEITACPHYSQSSAPGSGGGIGSGFGPYAVGNAVKSPQVLLKSAPSFTEKGRKARAEGSVLIEAVIHKDGIVDNFRILRGLGNGLDESAINTVAAKWPFRPGTRNRVPVDVTVNIEVAFHLY